jgi:hypothetical protein
MRIALSTSLFVALCAASAIAAPDSPAAKKPAASAPASATKSPLPAPKGKPSTPAPVPMTTAATVAPPAKPVSLAAVPPAPAAHKDLRFDLRLGGLFPAPFNSLRNSLVIEGGASWQLGVLDHRLGVFAGASYARPTAVGTRPDARVPGGVQQWDLRLRDFGISAGLQFVQPALPRLFFYGAAGAKLHLLRSVMKAYAGGQNLGTNDEQSTRLGLLLRAGSGYEIGPGAILGEIQFEGLSPRHFITGDSNTNNLSLQVGYQLAI